MIDREGERDWKEKEKKWVEKIQFSEIEWIKFEEHKEVIKS